MKTKATGLICGVLFLLSCYTQAQTSLEEGSSKIIVISDIDDTIKFRGHGRPLDPLIHFFRKEIYPEMRDLYRDLASDLSHRGIDFFYISGKNKYLFPTRRWLDESGFPHGETFLRGWDSGPIYPYKKGTIEKIIKPYTEGGQNPTVLFFGDDTSKDPQIYLDVVRENQLQDTFIFIREVKRNKGRHPGVHYFSSEEEIVHILENRSGKAGPCVELVSRI